jgi:hypothetical protein
MAATPGNELLLAAHIEAVVSVTDGKRASAKCTLLPTMR